MFCEKCVLKIYSPWMFTLVSTPLLSHIQDIHSQSNGGTKVNTNGNLKAFVLKTSLLLYCTKLSQFTYPTNTVKDISPEGGLNLTVCSSLHKTDWEAKPDQSVLILDLKNSHSSWIQEPLLVIRLHNLRFLYSGFPKKVYKWNLSCSNMTMLHF